MSGVSIIKNSRDNHFVGITCTSYNDVMVLNEYLFVVRAAQKLFSTQSQCIFHNENLHNFET